MRLSHHAQIRMQQRGIAGDVVDWLLAYGAVDHQRGAEMFYFNKKSRKALERDLGRRQLAHHAKALDAYAICAEGVIATVGHRYRRVVRH